MQHLPVLLEEAIAGLAIRPDGIYIDATFGRGGHSLEILKRLGPSGRLMAIDKDPIAIAEAQKGPAADTRFCIVHASFAELEHAVAERGWMGKVNGILMDLGVSSPQLDEPSRGFSFLREGPLDMRMDSTQGTTAAQWLADADEKEIAQVLWQYGEERLSRRIAKAIVQQRAEAPLTTTTQLASLIQRVYPKKPQPKHPATRSFQAIRIFINRELEDLEKSLSQSLDVLAVGGRLSVISFHSLEDRIVKQFIQYHANRDDIPRSVPLKATELPQRIKKVGRLIRPTEFETQNNPRARSARLRVAEKIA